MAGVRGADRDVFLLGHEAVCPLGVGSREVLESLCGDRLGGDRVTRFDASSMPVDAAAEVRADLTSLLRCWPEPVREAADYDRKLELALACATLASERFHEVLGAAAPARRGIVLGVGLDVGPLERVSKAMLRAGSDFPDASAAARMNELGGGIGRIFNPTDLVTILLAEHFECAGLQESVLTACSSSTQAIAMAFEAIVRGDVDVVLVGGTDSLLNLPAYAAFAKLGIIQPGRDGPASACKPCDTHRRGTLLGEGAGLLLLASRSFAEASGVPPEIEMLGAGSTLDGHHITSPDPTGDGMKRAMRTALTRSGIEPEDLDYVNLHGTGTRANDAVELAAVDEVVGSSERPLMVSSTKDRHGHLIAAAGIMETIVVDLCMRHELVPRTVNLTSPIATSGLDPVMGSNRRSSMDTCMSNSFAFGGINTSLVFRRHRAA